MKNKVIKIFLCMILIFNIATSTTLAYNTFNGHKLIYGVGNYGSNRQYYWISSTASSHTTTINNAMSEWIYTTGPMGITTPISYRRTSTKSSSRMDIYKVSTVNSWWGYTLMYHHNNEINPSTANWVWGKILLDGDFASLSSSKEKAVIAHEMGHVMGLAHAGTNSLMRYDIAFCTANITRAQTDDLNGINYLY